jgi:hypothetical protein
MNRVGGSCEGELKAPASFVVAVELALAGRSLRVFSLDLP